MLFRLSLMVVVGPDSAITPRRNGLIISAQMSSIPLRFPTPGKEAPFDAAPIHKIISDLLVCATSEVESEQLEIKGRCRDERELAEKVAEACACIANTTG